MTRIAVLADIHGNLPALEAVVGDLREFGVDRVAVAGDAINWGPFSGQVLELITQLGWAVIRGNNEVYLLDYGTSRAPLEWSDPSLFPLLPWHHRQIAVKWQRVIAAWPDTLGLRFPDAPPIRVVHAAPGNHWHGIYPSTPVAEVEAALREVEETTVVAGHIHLPMDRQVGRWRVLNSGSAGLPLDGNWAAMYVVLDGSPDGWKPTFRRVPYDRERLFREFEREGFAAQCGVIGHLVLDEFRTSRPHVVPFHTWRTACRPCVPITMGLLDEFRAADRWRHTQNDYHLNRELAKGLPTQDGLERD